MFEQDDIVLIKPLGETKFQAGHTTVIFHDGTVVCSCRVTFNRFDYVLRAGKYEDGKAVRRHRASQ